MSTTRSRWASRALTGATLLLVLAAPVMPAVAGGSEAAWQSVVVSGTDADPQAPARAVKAVGGEVSQQLGVIRGVSARVPAAAVGRLRRAPGVRAVTPDARGRLMGISPTLGYDVTEDDGSLYNIAQVTRAKDAWTSKWTGKGVDIALIDSGVSPVKGVTSGNVLHGPDLSFESQVPELEHLDSYGHGTHMASIIAGRDQVDTPIGYAQSNTGRFTGIAPDARLISIKVAANDGATDVSQVIAAIDWVVEHAKDPGFNIKVLNLSYGTDAVQDPTVDPLCFAVENAWRAGITVVVASGNDGTNTSRLANPAQDPLIIAVGADDPMGTDNVDNDQLPPWAQLGSSSGRHVDLIAPAVHVLGLRVPGSRIDQEYPQAVVGGRFFRGSGTSQGAAVVSGLAALYLQKNPTMTPDQVKKALRMTAVVPNALKAYTTTVGVPDITKALAQKPATVQAATGATGRGSLEAARGSFHVNDGYSDLTGEQDIFGAAWDGTTWATATSTGTAWDGGTWNGNAWSGSAWSGNSWSGAAWSGNSWSGNAWSGNAWSGNAWTGNAWTGNAWTGNAWTGNAWSGSAWSGNSWSGNSWSSADWS